MTTERANQAPNPVFRDIDGTTSPRKPGTGRPVVSVPPTYRPHGPEADPPVSPGDPPSTTTDPVAPREQADPAPSGTGRTPTGQRPPTNRTSPPWPPATLDQAVERTAEFLYETWSRDSWDGSLGPELAHRLLDELGFGPLIDARDEARLAEQATLAEEATDVLRPLVDAIDDLTHAVRRRPMVLVASGDVAPESVETISEAIRQALEGTL